MTIKEKALKQIKDNLNTLLSEGFECTEIEEKPFNYESTIIKNRKKHKIQIYFGKKGIKSVIQGSDTTREYSEIKNLISGNYSLNLSFDNEYHYDEYIGTDESGKGDYFGPLVTAGVYVDKNDQKFLSSLGVRDSKDLSDSQIDEMAILIKQKLGNKITVVSINPEKYNVLYDSFQNVNKLLNWAHSKVIQELLKIHNVNNVIIDQFAKTPLDISLKKEFCNINFIQLPKAEKYLGVAAASIIARSVLNRWFATRTKEGFRVLKGASAEVENAAKNILKNNGEDILNNFVKLHFKTTKKLFDN